MPPPPQTARPPVRTGEAAPAGPLPRALVRRRVALDDGAATTVHVATYPRAAVAPAVVPFPAAEPLRPWCARAGVADALVGGFFVTPAGPPLGALVVGGRPVAAAPFDPRFAAARACLHIDGPRLAVRPLGELGDAPAGDVLQAGPALVRDGRVVVRPGADPEGFAAGAAQFDSDITAGRHPRAALAFDERSVHAIACEGRAPGEAGLTLAELARVAAGIGAHEAINLDGGGSASLVVGGRLVNRPRTAAGALIAGGRPILTAIALAPAGYDGGPSAAARA